MPDDEVETVKEEEDETKEDIEGNTAPVETKPKPIDYSKHRRHFLHVPVEKIRKTFAATTQNAASVAHGPKANQSLKSPNPALNIRRRKEAVAPDSPFADVPAVDTPGYRCTDIRGKNLTTHRLLWILFGKRVPQYTAGQHQRKGSDGHADI